MSSQQPKQYAAGSSQPERLIRTPQEVIDAAIKENRKIDWLCYPLCVAFAGIAIAACVAVVVYDKAWATWLGSSAVIGCSWLFAAATALWKSNTALRILEASLSDQKEAAKTFQMLRDVYVRSAAGPKLPTLPPFTRPPPNGGS